MYQEKKNDQGADNEISTQRENPASRGYDLDLT